MLVVIVVSVVAAYWWYSQRSALIPSILKVKTPREGTVVTGGGGSWIEQFRRNSKCVGENGTEFCDELIDQYEAMVGNELPIGKTLITQYYSTECPYCTQQMPIFNQILNEFNNGDSNIKYIFRQVDVLKSVNPGIKVVPSIIKFDGKSIGKYRGPAVYEQLKEWILTSKGKPIAEIRGKK